jgi:hypothetical protein
VNELVHVLSLLGSAAVAGFAFARTPARHGSKRWALLALGSYAASSVFSQFTLFHAPVTGRTWTGVIAAAVGLAYIYATSRETKEKS